MSTVYMNLTLPEVSVTIGPTWASYINTAITTIDSHDHTSGKGQRITPAAINIDDTLDLDNNLLTNAKATSFYVQSALLTDTKRLYVYSKDLYFNDVDGNQVQITSGGALNLGSVGGIGGDYGTTAATVFYTDASKTYFFQDSLSTAAILNVGQVDCTNINASGTGSFGSTLGVTGDFAINTNKFIVTASSGNTSVAGDVAINTNKFTVTASSGNTSIAGTLGVTSDFAINTNKFTVTAASGNTSIAGTLGVTGDVAINTNKFTVTAASGNTSIAGTLGVTSDFAINTNKFTVTAASGNTSIAGTLGVTGDVAINTNKFTVTAASGNTLVAGTLDATGDFAVNTNKFTVLASSGYSGFGTASPGSTLVVAGVDAYSSTNALVIQGTSNQYQHAITASFDGVAPTTGSALQFKIANDASGGNTAVMTLKGSGYTGFGTDEPTAFCDIKGAHLTSGELDYGLIVRDDSAVAAGVGGGILFMGRYTDGPTYTGLGGIQAVRENATPSNTAASLCLYSRADGGTITEHVRLTSAGYLGLNTTTPESLFAIKGSSGQADLFSITDTTAPTSGSEYGVAMIKTNSTEYALNVTAYNASGLGARIYTAQAAGTVLACYNTTTKTLIAKGGKVGIGTDAPDTELHVLGDLQLGKIGAGGKKLRLVGDTYGVAMDLYYAGVGSAYLENNTDYDTYLYVRNNYAGKTFSITVDGNIGVRTTTPESALAVKGTDGQADLFSITDITAPTSGDEYGVAMIKTNSTEYALNVTSYNASGLGARIYTAQATGTVLACYNTTTPTLVAKGGAVGVGTADPSSIDSDASIVASVASGVNFITSSSSSLADTQYVGFKAIGTGNSVTRSTEIGVWYEDDADTDAPVSYIKMYTASGVVRYLWVDNAGSLRMSGGSTDIGGTGGTSVVVGDQTAP